MVGSSHRLQRLGGIAFAVLLVGCTVGVGEGSLSGDVQAPDCLEGPFSLRPNYFSAEPWENTLQIRIQRGGDFEYLSDGLQVFVADAAGISERLGEAIPVAATSDAEVRMNFHLGETCRVSRFGVGYPVNLVSSAGEIIFDAIYAPEIDEDQVRIQASFRDVRFEDPSLPEERFAILSGEFSFLYTRGRPAQHFP